MINLNKIECIRKSKSPFKILDIFIFAIVIALTIALTASIFSIKGENVTVSVDGVITVYALNKDAQINIDGKTTIVIKNGECYVTGSTCANKTCEHMGKISRINQTIVCAQNNIVIKIIGKSNLAGSVG